LLASVVAVAAALMAAMSGAALADVCASRGGETVVLGGTSTCFSDSTSQAAALNGSSAGAAFDSQAVAANNSRALANYGSQAVALNGSTAFANFNCVATALSGEEDICP
jgi:hypothetical protein